MKKPVHHALVAEYAKRLRDGGAVGTVFPYPLSECDFTETQKLVINEARKVRKELLKKSTSRQPQSALKPQSLDVLEKMLYPTTTKSAAQKPAAPSAKVMVSKPTASVPAPAPQSLNKLKKMLFLQHEKCFFCGEKLAPADASIEHLNPLSLGGARTEDNEVVCHKSLNETFGNLPLKRKFEFVLKAAGSFQCPKK